MKKGIHPDNYRLVAFKDLNNGQIIITRSTAETSDTITVDGQSYPLVNVHISSSSHPFFTGEERVVDVEGRIDRFKSRVAASQAAKVKMTNSASKAIRQQQKREERAKDHKA